MPAETQANRKVQIILSKLTRLTHQAREPSTGQSRGKSSRAPYWDGQHHQQLQNSIQVQAWVQIHVWVSAWTTTKGYSWGYTCDWACFCLSSCHGLKGPLEFLSQPKRTLQLLTYYQSSLQFQLRNPLKFLIQFQSLGQSSTLPTTLIETPLWTALHLPAPWFCTGCCVFSLHDTSGHSTSWLALRCHSISWLHLGPCPSQLLCWACCSHLCLCHNAIPPA